MKLKGINEINNILNEFLEPFECSADMGEDFCYWNGSKIINYSFLVSENSDEYFKEFTHNLMPNLHCDIFLLSFFHELGHNKTIDHLEASILDYCTDIKMEISSKETLSKEDYFTYFNLPDEKAATEWGLNYIISHTKEVAKLWNELQPAILNFYKLNDVH